jgi:hypothetical protein
MLKQEARPRVSLIVNGMHEIGQKRHRAREEGSRGDPSTTYRLLHTSYCRMGCDPPWL